MPSTVDPSTIATGAGKIHNDSVPAAADLFSATAGVVASLVEAINQPLSNSVVSAHFTGSNNTTQLLSSSGGPFFVGDGDWISAPADHNFSDLFRVVDATTDAEIFNPATGLFVQVTNMSPPVPGTGFFNGNLTLTFNTPVPTGVVYKVYYGRQVTVGNLPESLSFPVIRRAQASDPQSFFPFLRDRAPTVQGAPLDIVNNPYIDSLMAQWKATFSGSIGGPFASSGGSAGFVNVGRKKNYPSPNDESFVGHQAAAFLSVFEKSIKSNLIVPWTKVDAALAATLNPSGAGGDVVQLNASDFFRLTGPDRTAVRLGVDMLEVTFSNGLKESFVITTFDNSNATRAHVTTLGGATPNFTANTAVTVKWIRTNFFVGGDNDPVADGLNFSYAGMGHYVPGAFTADPTQENQQFPPFFGAGTIDPTRADTSRGSWNLESLGWGGHFQSGTTPAGGLGTRAKRGQLLGDGSIRSYGGNVKALYSRWNSTQTFGAGGSPTFLWNPGDFFSGSQLSIFFSGTATVNLTITLDSLYTASDGDELVVFVIQAGTGAAQSSHITWPASFIFSGTDGNVAATTGTILKFVGQRMSNNFYFTRTDY